MTAKQNFRKAQKIADSAKTLKLETLAITESKKPKVKDNTGAYTRHSPTAAQFNTPCIRIARARTFQRVTRLEVVIATDSTCRIGWVPLQTRLLMHGAQLGRG